MDISRPAAASSAKPRAEGSEPERLPFGVCLGFGVGSFGVSIMLNVVTIFFPVLMTTILGQSAALAGVLLTVSKLYDIMADILIGVASDRTRSRMGRRRPYLLAGAIIGAVSLLMVFAPPALTGVGLTVYMAVALVIYSTGYSLFAVPYVAMAGEMTDGYHERTRLLSFRTFFIAIGQLTSAAVMAMIVEWGGGGGPGYAWMGAAAASLVFTTMVISFVGTRKAKRVERDVRTSVPAKEQWLSLLRNRSFVQLMTAKMFLYLAISVISTTKLLFLLNVLKVGYQGLVHLTLSQNITAMIVVPFWTWCGRRFGKTASYQAAILCLALLYASYAFTAEGITVTELWIRGTINGIGAAGVTLMGISMLPDVMEYDRKLTGQRREGVYSSIYAFMEKVAFAVGPGLMGLLFAAAGYTATKGGALVAQSHSTVLALYAGIAVLPALLAFSSFLAMSRYKLDERALADMPEYTVQA
ncbi:MULTISPECIES: MFS transporter [unclassified Novosphingobium]|uniref:MFS transporter n=1 Tax=unclassified Novosphingobium TaxID=2644732 RepID=UPI00020EED4F|nr:MULTISPECIES: MFS transporter [unclassified Novosphingobium]GFM29840.1 major facilitator superfamily transporter [Novosphingobium sp. PY1]CCA92871.1 major facilitator transporter [Novosphingobium sp. PP1Y]